MAERIRKIKVTVEIEIDTNKRTIHRTLVQGEEDEDETCARFGVRVGAVIEEALEGVVG